MKLDAPALLFLGDYYGTLAAARCLAAKGAPVHLADAEADRLMAAGVKALRVSPHTGDVRAVLAAFGAFVRGGLSGVALRETVAKTRPPGPLINGYLHGRAGMLALEQLYHSIPR